MNPDEQLYALYSLDDHHGVPVETLVCWDMTFAEVTLQIAAHEVKRPLIREQLPRRLPLEGA